MKKVTWRVINIIVEFSEDHSISASINLEDLRSQFFEPVVRMLEEVDYLPMLSIEVMRKMWHSPFSDSEYYTFLKWEDNRHIKVVLDVRLSDHPAPEYGNYSARERHIHDMKQRKFPDIGSEFDSEMNDTDAEYYDVMYVESDDVDIRIDGESFDSIESALNEMQRRVNELP